MRTPTHQVGEFGVEIERGEVQMSTNTIEPAAWSRHTLQHILLGVLILMSLSASLGNQAQAETAQMVLSSPPMIWVWQDRFGNIPASGNSALYNGYATPDEACIARGKIHNVDGKATFIRADKVADSWYYCILSFRCCGDSPGGVAYPEFGPRCPDPRHWIFYYSYQSCPATRTCPPVSSGEPPYIPDSNGQTCSRPDQETYTLTLTPDTATIEPNQSATFTATVTKKEGGAPDKDIPVTVEIKVDVTSGGHDHGEKPIKDVVYKRPKGTLSTTSGKNSFPITFTAEDISGTHTIAARCEQCVEKTKEAVVTVKVDGLEQIPDSQFYQLYERVGNTYKAVGETAEHHSNHFLTPAASEVLWRIASAYRFEPRFMKAGVLPLPLHVNDASLKDGGKFDINGTWSGSHKEHTRGVSVDIRANNATGAIDASNFANVDKLLNTVLGNTKSNGGVETYLQECTQDKKDQKNKPPTPKHKRVWPTCVSQLDGSQDDFRHYHLRLMGVAK